MLSKRIAYCVLFTYFKKRDLSGITISHLSLSYHVILVVKIKCLLNLATRHKAREEAELYKNVKCQRT